MLPIVFWGLKVLCSLNIKVSLLSLSRLYAVILLLNLSLCGYSLPGHFRVLEVIFQQKYKAQGIAWMLAFVGCVFHLLAVSLDRYCQGPCISCLNYTFSWFFSYLVQGSIDLWVTHENENRFGIRLLSALAYVQRACPSLLVASFTCSWSLKK